MSRGKARSVWRGNFFLQKTFFWLWNLRISARRFADKPSCNSSGFEFIQIESLGKVPWGHPHIHLQQKGWCKLGSYSEFREFVLSFWKRERERENRREPRTRQCRSPIPFNLDSTYQAKSPGVEMRPLQPCHPILFCIREESTAIHFVADFSGCEMCDSYETNTTSATCRDPKDNVEMLKLLASFLRFKSLKYQKVSSWF